MLARAVGLPLALAHLLVSRGICDADAAGAFLSPRLSALGDPFLLPGMADAVNRCLTAVDRHETVAVFGDYDVDGVTSTALLAGVLKRLGVDARPFLPHRMEEGYGLSVDALERCLSDLSPSLIITVDCGTGSVDAVRLAAERGVDVIVTDHHSLPDELAPAVAVVNPRRATDPGLHDLAGVGVTFKFCHALLKSLREKTGEPPDGIDLRDELDLVALGTIADVVPLTGENRILVTQGLVKLNEKRRVGLRSLAEVAGISKPIDTYEVGFQLGPRLNAAGRLGDAQRALSLIMTEDAKEAADIALHLDRENANRRSIEKAAVESITAAMDGSFAGDSPPFSIVAADTAWHPGVVGIVASRLVQRYHRPSVVIAIQDDGRGRGSCRSLEGFHIVKALDACADYLVKYGGHSAAAGLEIEPSAIDAFRTAFEGYCRSCLSGEDLRPVQKIDGWLNLRELEVAFVEQVERMKPFGMGNPTPVWGLAGVRIVGRPRVVGTNHLKLSIGIGPDSVDAIGFGMGDHVLPDGPLDVAGQLKIDTYFGPPRVVLQLQDIRPAQTL